MATSGLLRSRTARWLVPVSVVAVIAAGVAVDSAVASAGPALPARSAADLLASLAHAPAQPFSGTVAENADLGIPALPGGAASTSLSWQSLVTGSHTARVWYSSPSRVRVSLVGDLAESDVVRDGRDLWVWSSRDSTAEHTTLPSGASAMPDAAPPIDPATAAARVVAALDPSTSVTVDGTGRVAGRPVYELVLAPRASASLVGEVRLAVDSDTSVPLRLQVFARGASDPAFETAFTSISFDRPADSVFAFTPPSGARVSQSTLPTTTPRVPEGTTTSPASHPTVIGSGWTAVVELPAGTAPGSVSSPDTAGGSTTTRTLLQATTTVTGGFGTGRLLQTSLLSVLLLPDGRTFVGAVTPDLLERVAASATR